ncbi:MAG TPA: glyoxalase superfamily protein [Actinoplanes sp.]|nr:glyoxalase superfamily protein [Actinoplanes sp.]
MGQTEVMFDAVFPILTTPDLTRSLSFYRDLLGGEVTYRFPDDGAAVYVGLRLGRSHLGIGRQDGPGDLTNERVTLWVYAEDCDAGIARLRDAGVPVVQEPVDQPWGERSATVTDPDGNRVIIASRG